MTRFYVLLLTLGVGGSAPVAAEGALAIGSSGNIFKDGIAYGGSINRATKEAAITKALATCHAYTTAPRAAELCKIVVTFTRQCFATALDPAAGTPGFGWAIDPDKIEAEAKAMSLCQDTAGKERRKFCQPDQSYCDTKDSSTD
jgi:hypothetical protein